MVRQEQARIEPLLPRSDCIIQPNEPIDAKDTGQGTISTNKESLIRKKGASVKQHLTVIKWQKYFTCSALGWLDRGGVYLIQVFTDLDTLLHKKHRRFITVTQ